MWGGGVGSLGEWKVDLGELALSPVGWWEVGETWGTGAAPVAGMEISNDREWMLGDKSFPAVAPPASLGEKVKWVGRVG